jgi:hypothetical protein
MSDMTAVKTAPHTDGEYEAQVAQLFAEMRQINEHMEQTQANIDRNLAEIRALRLTSQQMAAETSAILSRLQNGV